VAYSTQRLTATAANTIVRWASNQSNSARVCQMTLDGREGKLRREASGFWQRCAAMTSEDGTITGAWEGSPDGRDGEHDFGLTCIKTG
jgi:hypothetical protein